MTNDTHDPTKNNDNVTKTDQATNKTDDLADRRRQAVQLRIDGNTLAEIRRITGLSAPTVIAAFRAWQTGGWPAIDNTPPGRPAGGILDSDTQNTARDLLLEPPAGHYATTIWSTALAGEVLAEHGIKVSTKTLQRYLERWSLSPEPLTEQLETAADPALQAWFRLNAEPLTELARRKQASLYWAGLHFTDTHCIAFAHNARRQIFWLAKPGSPDADMILTFLDGILHLTDKSTMVVLKGIDIARVSRIRKWLSENRNELTLILPDSEISRIRAPDEPPEVTAPAAQRAVEHTTEIQDKKMNHAGNLATVLEDDRDEPIGTEAKLKADQQSGALAPVILTHLQRLEAESIHIMREVVAETNNPVMLYSAGKDSAVMLHLARKAFYPGSLPFPLLHVDTGWKFRAMYEYRDRVVKEYGVELLTHINPDGVAQGVNPFTHGSKLHTDIMKTDGLKQALDQHNFDAAFGGARRDEEKSRAKERIFSFRTSQHRWDPKNQRPELWRNYNTRKHPGESLRVFPLSNWTELDIWLYIHQEKLEIAPLYFAAERPVVERDGQLIMVDDDRMPLQDGEVPMMRSVRFRTLGCYPLTAATESHANSIADIIQETLLSRSSERQGRMIDSDSAASMEMKKQEGYF